MKISDYQKFVKFMNMTHSEVDNEALMALRKANKILKSYDYTWQDIFNAKIQISAELRKQGFDPKNISNPKYSNTPGYAGSKSEKKSGSEVEHMLDFVLRNTASHTSYHGFVDDVNNYYEKNGFITKNQYAAIKRGYDNLVAKGRI